MKNLLHPVKNSIKYKLILTMTLLYLVFAILVLGIWYSRLKQDAEDSTISNMKTVINVSNTTFENQLQDIINVTALATVRSGSTLSTNILNILSNQKLSDAEIVAYRNAAGDYLISLCSFKKNLNGLMLSDFSGNSVSYGIITPYTTIMRENFTEHLFDHPRGTIFIGPHYSNEWYPNENDLVFSILRPVYGVDGSESGFAIADIKCQLFRESFDVNAFAKSALYVIDSKDGSIIFSPKNDMLDWECGATVSNAAFLEQLSAPSGSFYLSKNGQKLLAVYQRSPLTGWTTLSVTPQSEVLKAFSDTAHEIIAIAVFLIFLLIVLVFFFSQLLTRNIILLTDSVKKIDGERLSLSLSLSGNDEVNELAQQFDSMLIRIRHLLAEVKKREAEKRSAEISALQFQMNPHFLYNALNTIRFLASIQGIRNISEVAQSLSSLMHTNMDGHAFLTVEEDGAFVEAYISIQKYRYTTAFESAVSIDTNCQGLYLPKLLVQPLVENAIKHGLSGKQTGGILRITYMAEDNCLHIRVEDNGVGMSEAQISEIMSASRQENAGHIGLYNIQERIHLLFGDGYGLMVESQPLLFTRFNLYLPLLKEEDCHEKA